MTCIESKLFKIGSAPDVRNYLMIKVSDDRAGAPHLRRAHV